MSLAMGKKEIVDTERKRKHKDNLYSLLLYFLGVLLVNDQLTLSYLHKGLHVTFL